MRKIVSKIFIGAVLVSCGTKNTINDLAVALPIDTSIDLMQINEDRVPVVINPGRITSDTIKYHMPKVVQGTYAISNFGKFIDDFKALDYEGNVLEVN